jgi:hypothetical protein
VATLMVAACLAGVDAQGLQAVDGGRFPAAMDADLGLDNSLAASITLHSGARLAVLRAPDGDRVLLGRVTTQDVHVSLNVMGALRAGLALPRYKPVIFDDQRVSGAVAGDFGFFVQGPLAQGDRGRASLSAQLDLPLGGVDVWLGEPDPALEVLFAGERDLGRFQVRRRFRACVGETHGSTSPGGDGRPGARWRRPRSCSVAYP